MTQLPAPSAWRYEQINGYGRHVSYSYTYTKPTDHNYTPMFTQGQLLQTMNVLEAELDAIRASNRELTNRVFTLMQVEPMTAVADKFAHSLALELECVLADRPRYYDKAMQVLNDYRMAMNTIHEQHSPTFMGEPLLGGIEP